jgi:hypothetical protein
MGHPDEEPAGHGGVSHAGRPLNWPDAAIVSGDAVDIVARLKKESEVPLRSNGSLSPDTGPPHSRTHLPARPARLSPAVT